MKVTFLPIIQLVPPIVVGVLLLIAVALTLPKVDAYTTTLQMKNRNQAIEICAQGSKVTYTEKTSTWERTTEEPSKAFYAECLKLANIQ